MTTTLPSAAGLGPEAIVNALSAEEAARALERCCGSARWVAGMLAARPFASTAELHRAADQVWSRLGPADFREAFSCHPAIGARPVGGLGGWSAEEQSRAATSASAGAADELRALNADYLARFGYTFIVCATGKTAAEILTVLRARLHNDAATELAVAAAEQARITHLRLEKLTR